MAVPLSQVLTVAKYALGKTLKGEKRYPLVMMLEPLFQCNLACSGCGKIQYPKNIGNIAFEIITNKIGVKIAKRVQKIIDVITTNILNTGERV